MLKISGKNLRAVELSRSQLASHLRPGRLLRARVAMQLAPARFLVSVDHLNLVAESELPLQQGDVLQVQVEEAGERFLLKLLPDASGGQSAVNNAGLPTLSLGFTDEKTVNSSHATLRRQQSDLSFMLRVDLPGRGRTELRFSQLATHLEVVIVSNQPAWHAELTRVIAAMAKALQTGIDQKIQLKLEPLPPSSLKNRAGS